MIGKLQMIRILRDHNREELRRRCCSKHSQWSGKFTVLNGCYHTCCIPNLQFDLLLAYFDSAKLKIHSDGGKQLLVKFSINKSA